MPRIAADHSPHLVVNIITYMNHKSVSCEQQINIDV